MFIFLPRHDEAMEMFNVFKINTTLGSFSDAEMTLSEGRLQQLLLSLANPFCHFYTHLRIAQY